MTEYQKKYYRTRYQKRLDEKRCVKCNSQDERTLNGYATCEKCGAYMSERQKKRRERDSDQ